MLTLVCPACSRCPSSLARHRACGCQPCIPQVACPGGNGSMCTAGYSGWKCADCAPGYYRVRQAEGRGAAPSASRRMAGQLSCVPYTPCAVLSFFVHPYPRLPSAYCMACPSKKAFFSQLVYSVAAHLLVCLLLLFKRFSHNASLMVFFHAMHGIYFVAQFDLGWAGQPALTWTKFGQSFETAQNVMIGPVLFTYLQKVRTGESGCAGCTALRATASSSLVRRCAGSFLWTALRFFVFPIRFPSRCRGWVTPPRKSVRLHRCFALPCGSFACSGCFRSPCSPTWRK